MTQPGQFTILNPGVPDHSASLSTMPGVAGLPLYTGQDDIFYLVGLDNPPAGFTAKGVGMGYDGLGKIWINADIYLANLWLQVGKNAIMPPQDPIGGQGRPVFLNNTGIKVKANTCFIYGSQTSDGRTCLAAAYTIGWLPYESGMGWCSRDGQTPCAATAKDPVWVVDVPTALSAIKSAQSPSVVSVAGGMTSTLVPSTSTPVLSNVSTSTTLGSALAIMNSNAANLAVATTTGNAMQSQIADQLTTGATTATSAAALAGATAGATRGRDEVMILIAIAGAVAAFFALRK